MMKLTESTGNLKLVFELADPMRLMFCLKIISDLQQVLMFFFLFFLFTSKTIRADTMNNYLKFGKNFF